MVGVGIADVTTGLYATIGILAALRHRDATGQGQHVDLSLLDTQVSWLVNEATNYLVSGTPPLRRGNEHPNIVPYRVFATADGHIVLAVGNDAQFARLCSIVGLPELATDPRAATNPARVANRAHVDTTLGRALAPRPSADWLAALEPAGVPAGPVNTIDEVFADPHVLARGMRIAMPYPAAAAGEIELVGSPLKLGATPVTYRHAPPRAGEHTDAVLTALGLDAAEIARLTEAGVIATA